MILNLVKRADYVLYDVRACTSLSDTGLSKVKYCNQYENLAVQSICHFTSKQHEGHQADVGSMYEYTCTMYSTCITCTTQLRNITNVLLEDLFVAAG